MSDPGTPDSFYGEAPFPPQTVPQMQQDCWRTQPDLGDSWGNADLQAGFRGLGHPPQGHPAMGIVRPDSAGGHSTPEIKPGIQAAALAGYSG
jgi:hypothetical protein